MKRAIRKANAAEKKAQDVIYAKRCVNLGMSVLFEKMYSQHRWTDGVTKQEVRDLLDSKSHLFIFKDDATKTIQIVKYVATPAGWPTEEVRYRIPMAPF